ncbi:hypothetical protein HRbin06_00355 [archaeon HR06]|nr:hypothetical protein HRbin06_00355 [archaeon HR06]
MLSNALLGLFLGLKINELRGESNLWLPLILSLLTLFLSLLYTLPLAKRFLR